MTDKPHNNFFVTVFSNRENMVDLLTQLLPEVAEKVEIDTLQIDNTSYIDDNLQDLYSDIVYNCKSKKGKATKITLLFEHKSYLVAYPTLQLADYIFSILRDNVKNGLPLSLVIPIIFYHGEKPWKYKDLKSHYQGIDEDLERYIPNFDYHVIDLTQYSDENILSLKMSFLINSLIAFKHKNDSEYVKQHAERIFHHLEVYVNSDYTQLFFRSLAIYIMSSTKLTGQEMGQIIDTLPKVDREKMKSTYENIIDLGIEKGIDLGIEKGIEKGIFIGKKRGEELTKLKLTCDTIKIGMETVFINKIFGVSEKLIKLIKRNVDENFESEDLAIVLASELLLDFQYLGNDDIAIFCHLSVEKVEHLRAKLLSDEDV